MRAGIEFVAVRSGVSAAQSFISVSTRADGSSTVRRMRPGGTGQSAHSVAQKRAVGAAMHVIHNHFFGLIYTTILWGLGRI